MGTLGQRIAHSPMSQWWHCFAGHLCFSLPGHMQMEEPSCSLKEGISSLAKGKEQTSLKPRVPELETQVQPISSQCYKWGAYVPS